MKKIKILIVLLISTTLILYNTNSVYATNNNGFNFGQQESIEEISNGIEQENFNSLQESGTVSTNGQDRQENVPINITSNNINIITRLIGNILLAIPMFINGTMSEITSNVGDTFTIEKTITNHYDLFNLEYLINPISSGTQGTNKILSAMGENAATWFIGVRNIALVASIISLMYVAIRLATATIGTQKAKFKRMVTSWVESIVILLTLQIFIVVIILSSNWMVSTLNDIIKNNQEITTVEEKIMKNVNQNLDSVTQVQTLFFYILLYIMFTYYEFKFFVLYIGRLIRVAFYIIIAPLVCVTYPIDKIGDGRAQAFNHWILDISVLTFIQPIHLLIYIIMISSMGEIMIRNPLIGILFLAGLSHAEKTFKSILRFTSEELKLEKIKLSTIVKQ